MSVAVNTQVLAGIRSSLTERELGGGLQGNGPSHSGARSHNNSGARGNSRQARLNIGSPEIETALAASGRVFGTDSMRDIALAARAEITGAGPLQYWLEQPGVTDVLVNGADQVWVEQHGQLRAVEAALGSQSAVRALAVRLAALAGQRLDDAAPICDGVLPDGTRFHAVLPPISAGGATISLRVLRQKLFSLAELVSRNMVPKAWEPLLRGLVAGRANILIAGGTGSGKTTLLAALLGASAQGERLVTVEEAQELAPEMAHHISLVSRRANVEGAGEISLADLVRTALRMRPDRLVLGECRGSEVREVLQAMNTGHDGSMTTLHANNAAAVPARLEALGALAGMPREALAVHTVTAVDIILQVRRAAGVRTLCEIGVPALSDGVLRTEVVATWQPPGPPQYFAGWRELEQRWVP
ncbi:MAG: TadA family conjugal transfer-associated ATPase [Cellulomonadaceae bacterium]|jgi:pilus assembly protein CpaF|nr:TadA family conjugal transfer-associated ATPase [Cellulomonadaceae bacterium]